MAFLGLLAQPNALKITIPTTARKWGKYKPQEWGFCFVAPKTFIFYCLRSSGLIPTLQLRTLWH